MSQSMSDIFPLALTPLHDFKSKLEGLFLSFAGKSMPGDFPLIGVRCEPMPADQEGLFHAKKAQLGVRISDDTPRPCLTALHEIGHAIDWFGFGSHGYQSQAVAKKTVQSDVWQNWLDALETTNHVQRLRHLQANPSELENLPSPKLLVLYRLLPQELFARCFAQYFSQKSQNPYALQDLLTTQRETIVPWHWENDEFGTILIPKLDAIFDEQRW